jgi:hypothetical protein
MTTTFSAYRRICYQKQIAANRQLVVQEAMSRNKGLIKKIESYRQEKLTDAERDTNTVDTVCERIIQGDTLISAFFSKDPTKQSLDEVCQIRWLKDHMSPALHKLPADGFGAKYFIHGALHSIAQGAPRPNNATKTLDTYDPESNTYGVLKHTTVAGGSQDNQLRDVKDFVREMVRYFEQVSNATETFALYLDGPYYTEDRLCGIRELIPDTLTQKILITKCEDIIAQNNSVEI